MADGTHGCGTVFRNNGNDGYACIDESADGAIVVTLNGTTETLCRVRFDINGKDVALHASS